MQKQGYLLQDKGNIENYLGVNITTTNDGNYEMKQTGLICDIIHDLNLDHPSAKYEFHKVPAIEVLQADLDEPAFCKEWNYRLVIGKSNFLALNTRPDIAFAVHQCACWCSNPRKTHGAAIKRIGRYLRTTINDGIIFTPSGNHSLHAYCDTNFAGTWTKNEF